MSNAFKFALVVSTVVVVGVAPPALAQSYAFPTYAYFHPHLQRNEASAVAGKRFYDYSAAQGEQIDSPSAAAMGNSH
jgi:hypothetical protein